jgi:FAD/FMN-containing dehydrogenase
MGACNSVGFVPLYLSCGFTPPTPKLGMGIDNLISARLLLSSGEAITASNTENPDIFDAVHAGGQVLGIVSEVKITTHPLAETVGSADGST